MNSSTKKADKPKMTVKNGKVYGDALSAEEKKKIVMQKKKDKVLNNLVLFFIKHIYFSTRSSCFK